MTCLALPDLGNEARIPLPLGRILTREVMSTITLEVMLLLTLYLGMLFDCTL